MQKILIHALIWSLTQVFPAQALKAQVLDGISPSAMLKLHSDSLRGSIGPARAWWNATFYDVTVKPDLSARSIQGTTIIAFVAVAKGQRMQLDLQQPLVVDSITYEVQAYRNGALAIEDRPVPFTHEENVVWVDLPLALSAGEANTLRVHYHGKPRAAKNPPWDGGWIWKTDKRGNPWVSVACQGLGASVWYPCKDHQSDEPDNGAALHITVPDSLVAVGNGRLRSTVKNGDGTSTWNWAVSSPINTYNLIPYIGKYAHFNEVYAGVSGPLDCDYWVLEQDLDKAKQQFQQVKPMLACFEQWMGPFPWYEDGYKLVGAPHLGMEHQSAVAYGNGFVNGYLGMDLSGSGWGKKWDYIIIHESGHEWFGNSISTADIADMWVHEGFTMYSEVLYTECQSGKDAAEEYLVGVRNNISNDRPLIGPYGVNQEGSGDMYTKGASVVHMVRQIIGDAPFKAMLLEMQRKYRHKVVTSAEIEAFICQFTDRPLQKFFDQYLRTTQIPTLEWGMRKGTLWMRWTNCVDGFMMPITFTTRGTIYRAVVGTQWRKNCGKEGNGNNIEFDRNWYITTSHVKLSGSALPKDAECLYRSSIEPIQGE